MTRLLSETGLNVANGWSALSAWAQSTEAPSSTPQASPLPDLAVADALIETLLQREKEIERREYALDERQRALELAELELETSTQAFEAAEAALRETLSLADGAAQADLDRLARMYETMKPKDASAVFETMDPTFAAGFLGQMSPSSAAEVLAGLTPETAYRVSLVLAGRNMRVPRE